MSGRPTSSAGPRPYTASDSGTDDRPTTSYRGPQYTYDSTIYEGEEDYSEGDESPVEDVFAFIAPTTMESQQAAQSSAGGDLSSLAARQPEDYSQIFGITLPPEQITPISPLPQAYDPSAPYFPVSHPPPIAATPVLESQAIPEKPATLPTPPPVQDTPPSTGSHNNNPPESYRMRRLKPANPETPTSGTNPSRASAVSSREVRVSLRPPGDSIAELDYEDQSSWKHRGSSTAGSYETAASPSTMGQSSREGSVK